MASPVPFIQVDASNRLFVTEEAKAYLGEVNSTVGVVAVAGIYRTGKSFILNQLAGTAGTGFGVGNSVQAKTKGIWLWGSPLHLEQTDATDPSAPQELLLLDTEGLQSIDQTEGHDAKIFSLAILLASAFVYNSKNAIDNAAIDQLSLVAQLTQRILVHAEGGGDRSGADVLAPFFPKFTWLLRDFSLELVDVNGAAQTPDAYLEECLQPSKGTSAAILEQNATRSAIRTLFTERSCIALSHPTMGTKLPASALKELDQTPLSALNPDFVAGIQELKARLLGGTRAKSLGAGGPALTGRTLLHLAAQYCDAINDGALPNISSAFSAVIASECRRALDEAARLYVDGASAAMDPPDKPPDEAAWLEEHASLHESALHRFKGIAMGDGPAAAEAQAKLLEQLAAEKGKVDALLRARSEALCLRLVAALAEQFGQRAREATAAALAAITAADAAQSGSAPTAAAPTDASPAQALPVTLSNLMAEYERQAAGASKASGREALLARMVPLMVSSLADVEREQAHAAAAARQAAAAARTALVAATGRAQKAEKLAATSAADLRATREQLDTERADWTARSAEMQRAAEMERAKSVTANNEVVSALKAAMANRDAALASLREQLEAERNKCAAADQMMLALQTASAKKDALLAEYLQEEIEDSEKAAAARNGSHSKEAEKARLKAEKEAAKLKKAEEAEAAKKAKLAEKEAKLAAEKEAKLSPAEREFLEKERRARDSLAGAGSPREANNETRNPFD